MATQAPKRGAQTGRVKNDRGHEGFMRHRGYRWLNISLMLCVALTLGYVFADVRPRPNGGTWYGYVLGVIGTILILWLTMLGVRKRIPSRKRWSLKGWTSAHVYLGLSLIVIATLHAGFQIGWNVHTLAYVLMMFVILSGLFGVIAYAVLPKWMSLNREELTEDQMIDGLRSINRLLNDAAQSLESRYSEIVRHAIKEDAFSGGLLQRLFGYYPQSASAQALKRFNAETQMLRGDEENPFGKINGFLTRKQVKLARLRRHLRYKALLEVWLYFHIPLTFALIAALSAHIISVFFYW